MDVFSLVKKIRNPMISHHSGLHNCIASSNDKKFIQKYHKAADFGYG